MKRRLLLFGATGDLTARYLLPALAELREAGKLPAGFRILGIAREAWDTGSFRRYVGERLASLTPHIDSGTRAALLDMLDYRRADATSREDVLAAVGEITEPAIAYLALPPALFAPVVESLAAARLPEGSAIVLEKPFGEDLASARALNRLLHAHFPEPAVFRIDSFLGEQTALNVLGLRFANRVFEPLWNSRHVERVDIVWDETLTIEGRAAYYDGAGALRDMIQNHLLQLLCLVAMEPPRALDEHALRDRKAELLRAVAAPAPNEMPRATVRARYAAGRIGAHAVPAYAQEPGVDPARGTETFAQVVLRIDNERWAGVPFVLRTGKSLARDRMEIALRFRPAPAPAFGAATPPPNGLRFALNPDRIALAVNVTGPCDAPALVPVELDRSLTPQDLSAYARLLRRVMEGRQELFIRDDEAEESWRIVEPVLAAWARGEVPLLEYPAGSDGPAAPARAPHANRR